MAFVWAWGIRARLPSREHEPGGPGATACGQPVRWSHGRCKQQDRTGPVGAEAWRYREDGKQRPLVRAPAAVLEGSVELKVPECWTPSSPLATRTGPTHERLHGTCSSRPRQRNKLTPSRCSGGSTSTTRSILPALEGLKMVARDQNGAAN